MSSDAILMPTDTIFVFNVQGINVRVSGKRNHEFTRINTNRPERVFNVHGIKVNPSILQSNLNAEIAESAESAEVRGKG